MKIAIKILLLPLMYCAMFMFTLSVLFMAWYDVKETQAMMLKIGNVKPNDEQP